MIRAIYKQPGRGEKLDGGKIPGQVFLQDCINNDEDDLPFAAIQLGLYLLGEDHFNHLLEIRDCPHRIAKVHGKHVLMVSGHGNRESNRVNSEQGYGTGRMHANEDRGWYSLLEGNRWHSIKHQ